MTLPEMTSTELLEQAGVTVEKYLETLWGIRPGETRPRLRPVATRYDHGEGVDAWLGLWGLGGDATGSPGR
jgi:hypothetical protein